MKIHFFVPALLVLQEHKNEIAQECRKQGGGFHSKCLSSVRTKKKREKSQLGFLHNIHYFAKCFNLQNTNFLSENFYVPFCDPSQPVFDLCGLQNKSDFHF